MKFLPYFSLVTGKAAPEEIEHHFSIKFPGMQCNIIQSHNELYSSIKDEVSGTLSAVSGCNVCQLKEVTVPGCESLGNNNKRRAVDDGMEVLFSLVIKQGDRNSSSAGENVEQKSEAVLFQMQYAVAAGEFTITLLGMNATAGRSSFQHVFSTVKCSAGFVVTSSGKECGKHFAICTKRKLFNFN